MTLNQILADVDDVMATVGTMVSTWNHGPSPIQN